MLGDVSGASQMFDLITRYGMRSADEEDCAAGEWVRCEVSCVRRRFCSKCVGESAGADPEDASAERASGMNETFQVILLQRIAEDRTSGVGEAFAHPGRESFTGQPGRQGRE